MLENGFVRISRNICKWRWYTDPMTCRLFFHLLLTANYEDHDFETITIHRGQRAASLAGLANETGLSVQNIRTALRHLTATGEVTYRTFKKYSLFTINCYEEFQTPTDTATSSQHTANKPLTSKQQQCKKEKKEKKEKNLLTQEASADAAAGNEADGTVLGCWPEWEVQDAHTVH